MHRLWVKLLLVGALLALAFAWWWVSRPGAPSRLTAFLPAEGIKAAVFIDDPADLIVVLETRFSGDATRPFSDAIFETLDFKPGEFDPRDVEAWDQTGVTESAGVAVVLHEATGKTPIVMARVDDEDTLVEWLDKTLGEEVERVSEGDVRRLTLGTTPLLLGERGRYTALMRGGTRQVEGFRAFLNAAGPLTVKGPLRTMFRTAATRPRIVAFAETTQLARLTGEVSPWVTGFLNRHAPFALGFLDDVQGAVSISLTEAGRGALKTLTAVEGAPPAFSRLMPAEGWSALRFSLDLGHVFSVLPGYKFFLNEGLRAWPGWDYVDAVERAYARIGDSLSGHFVVAFSNTSLADMLANPAKAELDWVVFAGIAPNEPPKRLNGLDAPADYVDGVAVFASSDAVLKTIKPAGDDLPGPQAHRLLDDDLLFGLTLTAKELLSTVESAVPPRVFKLFKTSRLAQQPHLSIGFALKADRIVSRGDTSALIATAGLVGLVVYPSLARLRRVRWQREARTFVRRMAEGATAEWLRRLPETTRRGGQMFPSAAPLTPESDQSCGPFPANPRQWDTPTWKALNFAVHGAHRYRYAFEADQTGFTARAVGDLDCDGVLSRFEMRGQVVGPKSPDGTISVPLEIVLTSKEFDAAE